MRRSHAFRWIGWIAVLALLAQAWLTPLAARAVARQVDGVVICTGAGFKIVTVPTDDRPLRGPSDDRSGGAAAGFDCAACLHGVIGKVGLPGHALCLHPIEHDVALVVLAERRPSPRPIYSSTRSRAPPLV